MNWGKVGKAVAEFAPLLGGVLGGPAGAAVGSIVARTFGVDDTPDAVAAAIVADPGAGERLKTLEMTHRVRFEEIEMQGIVQTNATYQVELASDDEYVRRARPGLIYMVKDTLKFQIIVSIFGGIVALLVYPEKATDLIAGIVAINNSVKEPMLLAIGVIGVYVRSRSTHDKPIASGKDVPKGLIQTLLKR